MDKYFVTILGIGYSKFAPGTLGSLFGVLFFFSFYNFFYQFPIFLFLLITFLFLLGWYFTYTYVKKYKIHDPSEIIIDEFIGQLISLCPIIILEYLKINQNITLEILIFSFFLFRFFDILKPWPINLIDRSKTSLSILLDDIIAGLFSAIIIIIYITWI